MIQTSATSGLGIFRRPRFFSGVLAFALTALLAGFVQTAAAQAKPRDINIGLQAAITSMDPHYHNLSPNNSMMLHIFEGLISRDENQKMVPGLATSWRPIDDLTWEFKMAHRSRRRMSPSP